MESELLLQGKYSTNVYVCVIHPLFFELVRGPQAYKAAYLR